MRIYNFISVEVQQLRGEKWFVRRDSSKATKSYFQFSYLSNSKYSLQISILIENLKTGHKGNKLIEIFFNFKLNIH